MFSLEDKIELIGLDKKSLRDAEKLAERHSMPLNALIRAVASQGLTSTRAALGIAAMHQLPLALCIQLANDPQAYFALRKHEVLLRFL